MVDKDLQRINFVTGQYEETGKPLSEMSSDELRVYIPQRRAALELFDELLERLTPLQAYEAMLVVLRYIGGPDSQDKET